MIRESKHRDAKMRVCVTAAKQSIFGLENGTLFPGRYTTDLPRQMSRYK